MKSAKHYKCRLVCSLYRAAAKGGWLPNDTEKAHEEK
jgi:hypothetical protein